MCSHFEALRQWEDYKKYFDVLQPTPPQGRLDMWPRYTGVFIRKPPETDPHDEAIPAKEALAGRWGLVPWWASPYLERIEIHINQSLRSAGTTVRGLPSPEIRSLAAQEAMSFK